MIGLASTRSGHVRDLRDTRHNAKKSVSLMVRIIQLTASTYMLALLFF